jgi:hypothetical protein
MQITVTGQLLYDLDWEDGFGERMDAGYQDIHGVHRYTGNMLEGNSHT